MQRYSAKTNKIALGIALAFLALGITAATTRSQFAQASKCAWDLSPDCKDDALVQQPHTTQVWFCSKPMEDGCNSVTVQPHVVQTALTYNNLDSCWKRGDGASDTPYWGSCGSS